MHITLKERISERMGAVPLKAESLGGGCIADVRKITLSNGETIVAKIGSAGDQLHLEGEMLEVLEATKTVPLPRVILSDDDLLLMEYIPSDGVINTQAQAHAAPLIAALHKTEAQTFGFYKDTVIGALSQPNLQTSSWVPFFRDHRLLYMAQEAYRRGKLPSDVLIRIEKLAGRLAEWLKEPEAPALLHGDLWTGNVLIRQGKLVGLVDPAIYYGHREIELAFSTLFGTFGQSFFKVYHQCYPIKPGFFEERLELYNLYPLLVHVRLFGQSYLGSIVRTLDRFGC